MQTLMMTWAALLSLASLATADVTIAEEIQGELASIERKLDAARNPGEYLADAYFEDLTNLGKKVGSELQAQLLREADLNRSEILLQQSAWLQDESIATATGEIGICYGRPAYAVPQELRLKLGQQQGDTSLRVYKPDEQNRKAGGGAILLPLFEEHKKPDYRPAHEILLMSPPSRTREMLKNRACEALLAIGDPSSIPVLLECYKKETGLTDDLGTKRAIAVRWIDVIRGIPSERALDALIECNRLAIEGGYNGEGRLSLSRHIARGLSSRRMYADQMEDPAMVKMLRDHGQPVDNVEDVPPIDNLWKKYKPLLRKRVSERTDKTPSADVALGDAALAAMPEK